MCYLGKNHKGTLGISPLVTVLLMIVVALAASVVSFAWVMSLTASISIKVQTRVRIDMVNWNPLSNVTITIRNTGTVQAIIDSISIRKNKAGSSWITQEYTITNSIDKETVKDFYWTKDTLLPGTFYVIRITTTTGLYYELIATTPLES